MNAEVPVDLTKIPDDHEYLRGWACGVWRGLDTGVGVFLRVSIGAEVERRSMKKETEIMQIQIWGSWI